MTPLEAAEASTDPIMMLAAHFMLDPTTYQRGAELGFSGIDFYYAGRCGVLGSVDADVVAAALVFFNPDTVRSAWESGLAVMEPADATAAFATLAHASGQRLPDDADTARLGQLAGRIITAANPACAALFAGWRALAEPEDPRALAMHRMQVLRELRGNLHGSAVLAAGLRPVEALMVRTPYMAGMFGWADAPAADPHHEELWQQAEHMTNVMISPAFEALTEDERAEFVTLAVATLVNAA